MTRHSLEGALITGSTADAMFRPPALTSTARRPPNSGTVCASSMSRDGLPANSSPSMRASANGSLGSSTGARTSASTLSRTRPMSGPKTNTTGCAGFGLAMKRSTSAALMAVMTPRELRAGHEERGESIADIFGDFPGGTIFGIAQAALAGKSLLLARNVVRHAREGLAFDNNASGRQLRQRICAVDAVIVDVGTRGVDIDDNLQLRCGELYVEAVRRRKTAAAAGQIVNQLVPHIHADARETATGGGVDCGDVDGAHRSDDARTARSTRQRMLGVHRLKTPGNETSEPHHKKDFAEGSEFWRRQEHGRSGEAAYRGKERGRSGAARRGKEVDGSGAARRGSGGAAWRGKEPGETSRAKEPAGTGKRRRDNTPGATRAAWRGNDPAQA